MKLRATRTVREVVEELVIEDLDDVDPRERDDDFGQRVRLVLVRGEVREDEAA